MFILDDMKHDISLFDTNESERGLVSAVIPVYEKKRDTLDKCLEAVINQAYRPLEVIVVNNGVKNLQESLPDYGHPVRVVNLDSNYGASYARNHGAFESSGEYLWFVDSDIIAIDVNCVETMLEILRDNSDIGALGGIIYEDVVWLSTTIHIGQCIDHSYSDHPEKYTLFDDKYVNTGCMMVRRRVFNAVKGFTEYLEYLHEDNDFGYKIRAEGLRCVGDYHTVGLHIPKGNTSLAIDVYKMGYKNTILCLLVNFGFIEFLEFLHFKLAQKKNNTRAIALDPPVKLRSIETLHCRLKQLYSLAFASAFLAYHFRNVITLRRKRQSLLRKLRDTDEFH